MSNASDFIIENGVLTKYVGPGGDVVIPEGVTDEQVKFLWMRTTLEAEEEAELNETENLTREEIGKEKTYTLTSEDAGYIVILQITGLEEMGYTGVLEAKTENVTEELLGYLHVLVDGPFVAAKKNLKLRFRGSENQRLIDVPKTLQQGEVVLWED